MKQKKIKIESRIKMNYNIYLSGKRQCGPKFLGFRNNTTRRGRQALILG